MIKTCLNYQFVVIGDDYASIYIMRVSYDEAILKLKIATSLFT